MEKIALRDYFDLKGFGKYTSHINVGDFAKQCGVNISVISRILKGKYEVKNHSEVVNKINRILNIDGYELELINLLDTDKDEEIARLKEIIKQQDIYIELLGGEVF